MSTDQTRVAKREVLCTYYSGMSFSVWRQRQQLWEGATETKIWLLGMKGRMNQEQLKTAGAISLLETVLKLFKLREKATQNVKQQPSEKTAAICIVLDLPHSMIDWEFCFLLWKTEMASFVCLTLKGRGSWRLYLFNPKTWERTEHCHFPKSFCFYFPSQPVWVLFALWIFHRQFATSLGHLWVAFARGCQLKERSL